MPRVSIIIPLYNKIRYIENCLELLTGQKYQDFEIIVVDDGSDDGSYESVQHMAESSDKIRLLHQDNQGVSSARNKGLREASGEWIWFVDADDRPDTGWLDSAGAYLTDTDIDIIFGEFIKVRADGKEERITTGYTGKIPPAELPAYFMKEQYSTGFFGYLWCKLIRRSFIESCKAEFEKDLTLAEDLKFMVRLYRHSPQCLFLHNNAMYYTMNAENSSVERDIDYRAQTEIQYQIFQWIGEKRCLNDYRSMRNFQISNYVACVFFHGFEKSRSITEETEWMQDHPGYAACLDIRDMSGVMKWIILLIKIRCYQGVRVLLDIRMKCREIYRRVRR